MARGAFLLNQNPTYSCLEWLGGNQTSLSVEESDIFGFYFI
jgi:hypothetical protein